MTSDAFAAFSRFYPSSPASIHYKDINIKVKIEELICHTHLLWIPVLRNVARRYYGVRMRVPLLLFGCFSNQEDYQR